MPLGCTTPLPVPANWTGSSQPRLLVERAIGHEAGVAYDLTEGATLGRGDVEIRLDDPFASSRHARISREGHVVVIEDLGSTNGTYLNEEPLTGPQPLHRRGPDPDRRLRILLPAMTPPPRLPPNMLRAAHTTSKTDTGRARRENEDSSFARAPLFVVADGMGGAQAGEVASKIAVEVFEGGLPEGGTPEERLVIRPDRQPAHL